MKIQKLVAARLASKTRVVFNSSPGYASIPRAPQFVYAVLALIVKNSVVRMLLAASNRELEWKNLKVALPDTRTREQE